MFSKILVRLIDQSITPAVLLLSARVVSIILLSKAKGIPFNLDITGFTFSSYTDYTYLNSYSTIIMVLALVLGMSYVLLKAYVFHDSHITPRVTANVFAYRLSNIIQSSYDLYTQGSIWLSFMFFMVLAGGFMAAYGLIYAWVFYASLGLLLMMLVLFILDIENEVKIPGKSAWHEEENENE